MGKCQICGKPTRFNYPFCRACYDKIIAADQEEDEDKTKYIVFADDRENQGHCLICGHETTGTNHFCHDCYQKYKEKELILKIEKCNKCSVMDESYEGERKCKDGHIAKSKSERTIDDFLFDHNIKHIYEPSLSFGPNPENVIHPDFLLPNFKNSNGSGDVYIEHLGGTADPKQKKRYEHIVQYKIPLYQTILGPDGKRLTLLCIYEEDMDDAEGRITQKLNYLSWHIINYPPKKS
jgi:hypothetical protein